MAMPPFLVSKVAALLLASLRVPLGLMGPSQGHPPRAGPLGGSAAAEVPGVPLASGPQMGAAGEVSRTGPPSASGIRHAVGEPEPRSVPGSGVGPPGVGGDSWPTGGRGLEHPPRGQASGASSPPQGPQPPSGAFWADGVAGGPAAPGGEGRARSPPSPAAPRAPVVVDRRLDVPRGAW